MAFSHAHASFSSQEDSVKSAVHACTVVVVSAAVVVAAVVDAAALEHCAFCHMHRGCGHTASKRNKSQETSSPGEKQADAASLQRQRERGQVL